MKSTENKEERLLRVDMHNYFLSRIEEAMKQGNYIEASWLIYSCFENRYFRTLQKYRDSCKYCRSKGKCNNKKKNELALATKVRCVQRLYNNDVSCVKDAFREDLFIDTLDWIKKRNVLMHELLSLEYYQETDKNFKASAEIGLLLLNETYECCTRFRAIFYNENYNFHFPDKAMEECPCKPRDKEK